MLQASPSWVYKGEWNSTLNQSTFVELRAGQFGYNFGLDSNNNDTRYESLNTREVLGGGRDWELRRRRNQVTGAVSYFKDRFAGGSHNLKAGGEWMDEKGQTLWNSYYKDNVVHFVNGSLQGPLSATTPVEVRLTTNGNSWSALGTTSAFVTDTWTIDKLTLNLGARFDRYRVYLPEQSVAAGRFVPRGGELSRQRQHQDLQPHRPAHRRDLRPDRRRQDRAEGELGPLLLQPRHRAGRRGQRQHRQPVRRSRVERPQRRPHLPGRRGGHPGAEVSAARPARRSIRT